MTSKELLTDSASLDEKQRKDLKVFQASKNWVLASTKRYVLRSVPLHGEAGREDAAAIESSIAHIRKRLAEYTLDCI